MKILKHVRIVVLVMTGVSLGMGSVSALASGDVIPQPSANVSVQHVIRGIDEDGVYRETNWYRRQQSVRPGDPILALTELIAFKFNGSNYPDKAPLAGVKVNYDGRSVSATVDLHFVNLEGVLVSTRQAGGKLTLGGVADLTPPKGYELVDSKQQNQIVLMPKERRQIVVKPVPEVNSSVQKPSHPALPSKPDLPQPQPGKPYPAPGGDRPQPTDPTPAVPNPQPAPNPAKPQPSKPTLPTAPTPQPQPSKPALPTQPVISHPAPPASPTNPTHQSLTTNLPAVTKPRPWAHHSAVDLWEAAPDTAADTATTPSQATAHPHTSPATGYHHQAAHTANQPSAAPAPAKSPAKASSAAKRLPQTNDRSNWPAVVIGSLLLSFTGIWRNRRIHQ
ncbi:MAG: LPXTG cell wall anchor domain-containing protein [Levilactobacillus sp.]|uniref:LPXTG cell wall anchor domain-containing protein n=1 Tax=Levilactobacillus sp. TaxID=2767919 RepID=UPI0025834A8D|nr:LPXTG cell wall anchor domain-containing protein [Levilactobacillus sp.]MCH4124016.1 LPXTG cell wall anchor domain-containing protein [Levilactobacillus sp.]MCI1554148.1 LPXTG cell wall anchor domain-containing protein [Levilactobacillus sp.]MCI1599911.1 LPXTG cell wall anchor domain-containing protein [Levilactobacillus sp.]